MNSTTNSYALTPERLVVQKKRLIVQSLIIYAIAVLAGLYIALRNDLVSSTAILTLAIDIPLFAVLIVFVLRRALKLQREAWASFKLTVSSDTITRQQVRLPDLTLQRVQITRIEELPGT